MSLNLLFVKMNFNEMSLTISNYSGWNAGALRTIVSVFVCVCVLCVDVLMTKTKQNKHKNEHDRNITEAHIATVKHFIQHKTEQLSCAHTHTAI